MQGNSILYRRRIKPKPPPVIPEGDYQDRERISIDSSKSSLGQPGYAQSEFSVPRDKPNTKRSWSVSDVPTKQEPQQSYPSFTNHFPQSRNYPLQRQTNPTINSLDGCTLPPNSQDSSRTSSQQRFTSSSQSRLLQGTENARNIDRSPTDLMPRPNTLENKRPGVPLENNGSVLDQGRVAAWNGVEYSWPSVEPSRDFANSHQHIEADSVSLWSGKCEIGCPGKAYKGCEDCNSNTFPYESRFVKGDESLYQTRYGTNPAKPDGYHSAGIRRPMQSSAKQPQDFDISNGLRALQVGDEENSQDMTDNSGMGNLGDSTLSIDSASSNSTSDDDCRSSHSEHELKTGINLLRSYNMLSEDANVFRCDVDVWQNGLGSNPNFPDQLRFITLLFDTQCQGSNWVATKIVDNLGAKVECLSYPAEFIGFNGQSMVTRKKTTLWFKKSCGGSAWGTDFLVSPVEKVPFDMLLGARDCLRFNIIEPPALLGLAGAKQSKYQKEAEAARIAQHNNDAKEHERKIRKMKDKQARRSGESSNGKKNKRSGSS